MIIKIKLYKLWVICTVIIAASYPLSVRAATALYDSALVAPFVFSWAGVWVFSGAGGLGASFIIIEEVDNKLRHPVVAKFVIGLFWGVGISLLIDALTSTPLGALTFFSLVAASFSTPVTAGAMVWLSNQRRINSALNQVARKKTGIDLHSIDEVRDDTDKL